MVTLTFLLLITVVVLSVFLLFRILDLEKDLTFLNETLNVNNISLKESLHTLSTHLENNSRLLEMASKEKEKMPKKNIRKKSNTKKQEIISYIQKHQNFTRTDLTSSLKITKKNDSIYMNKILNDLIKENVIKRVKRGNYTLV
jgi:uncharacterized membrane protein